MRSKTRIAFPLQRWLLVAPLLLGAACGGPQALGDAGATCFRDDDCEPGLICVAPMEGDINRVCSNDPTPLISNVEGPPIMEPMGGAAGAAGMGGAIAGGGMAGGGAANAGSAGSPAAGTAGSGGGGSDAGGTAGGGGTDTAGGGGTAAGTAGSGGTDPAGGAPN